MVLLIRNYLRTETARRNLVTAQIEAERLEPAPRSGFLSRVSHELRTPLNAILGFGQLLEREPLEPGERETLDQMLTGGRHLLAIVDDLLDLSRIEAGELRLSIEPVQVADAVGEASSLLSQRPPPPPSGPPASDRPRPLRARRPAAPAAGAAEPALQRHQIQPPRRQRRDRRCAHDAGLGADRDRRHRHRYRRLN